MHLTKKQLVSSFGYYADPSLPLWKNVETVLSKMTSFEYFHRPKQMAYHDLCDNLKAPDGIGVTLGLGLKFCVQSDHPPDTFDTSFTRFAEDVRKKVFFAGSPPSQSTPQKIYVKSNWVPPCASANIENRITNFCHAIRSEHRFLRRTQKKASNLTNLQKSHINFLRSNKDFIILNADKNLGPVIMERANYIKQVLHEHLLDEETYEHISEDTATKLFEFTYQQTMKLLDEYKEYISEEELIYFKRSFAKNNRFPQFYGMPKVHKQKIPIPLRPVVSQCGSLFAVISIFIDFKLQSLTSHIPSYISNSEELLNDLDKLGPLPPSSKLFTSDATSMYSNIDPAEALPVLEAYLNEFSHELNDTVRNQMKLLVELTRLVMQNNVFKFGSTWWKQLVGTAMGTSCACIYATVFFAYFERKVISTKYKSNFIFYRRKIDDIFAIWKTDPSAPNAWNEFKSDLNSLCKLEWNTEDLCESVNFLDLTIWIDDDKKIKYKTYQKEMNLYLYIPKHSASPPGLLRSLVFGLLGTYKRQNSDKKDFNLMVSRLFERLVARGYQRDVLSTLFLEAAEKLNSPAYTPKTRRPKHYPKAKEINQLFFHLPYHPRGVSRRFIQQQYHEHCERPDRLGESFRFYKSVDGRVLSIDKLTVAYSRPRNLRDLLSPSKLLEFDDCNVQQFL